MKLKIKFLVTSLTILASTNLQAAVIDYGNVAGLKTFLDTNTNRVWLDMNNFFDDTSNNGTTGLAMISTAQKAGFTFAKLSDVQQLLDSLPLENGQWSTYAPIMGYGIPRNLIWGMFDDDDGNPYGWAFAFENASLWSYANNATNANFVENGSSRNNMDMGIWAYAPAVPEPETYAMMLAGLSLIGFTARRKALK